MTLRLPCVRSADMEGDPIDLAFSKDTLIHARFIVEMGDCQCG